MSEKDRILDENLRRLMQAGLGEESTPSPQAREKVFLALQEEARQLYEQQDFPPLCLALLGGCVLCGSVVLLLSGSNLQEMAYLLALIPGFNLLLLPVAAYLIIKRRLHDERQTD